MSAPEWAVDAIEVAKLEKSHKLYLDGSGNRQKLSEIPDDVFNLSELRHLILSNNSLTTIPDSIKKLGNLTFLDLWHNKFSVFPEAITRLPNLIELDLSENEISQLPVNLTELKKLGTFDLRSNQLTDLPEIVTTLTNLNTLRLDGNPWVTPPPEIANKGINSIQEYYRQLHGGKDHLYEAKFLILGEGGAGKTSLAKKIEDPNYQLQEEKSTEGVDVIQWSFPIDAKRTFRVNIWDFGGQEIYHTTHQFFLTKRSLYALVADTRKEDTDFYYWLNVVELLSDSSPLLIIKNEKQDRHREINERQLRGQFDNLKEILATNLATNRGLETIVDEIKHFIQHLPHIGSPLPKTWVRVREKLENDERNYIFQEEYLKICKENGFIDIKDGLQLSEYLHDIGVFLHFQDDPLLRKIVILKPKWGTDAVYKVLDNKKVIRNLGHFTRADVETIWWSVDYENMRDELLRLMMKFKLCYEIPNKKGAYIAPQLLTENQPEYKWDEKRNLFFRYTYEFMPKGILTQFIVVMHPFIWEQKIVWKSGVVLEKNKTRAEVVEHYGKREIHVRVTGDHKKDLMTIVVHELDKIHENYKSLKYDKLIPCNCRECRQSKTPHFYPFERLQKFIEDGQDQIQCQQSYAMVGVRTLVDDIIGLRTEKEVKELMAKTLRPIKGNINIGDNFSGTLIVGSTVESSLNKVQSAHINNELKTTLKQLILAVETMKKKLPQKHADETTDDLEKLINEVIKKSPNKKWYSVSINGLTKAAENLGKVGEPVIELAGKVLKLLAAR